MSDFYNKYPYTDFHELNLDWVIERVKKLTEDWLATQQEWNDTEEQWQQLHDYVMNYFDNLDVSQEINDKIDAMVLDGTFLNVIRSTVESQTITTTEAWLAAHITQPTTPVVDDTLSISGAAADALATGNAMASNYNASSTYAIGDYCLYNGKLYECTTAITTPEAWTAAHWSFRRIMYSMKQVKDTAVNSFLGRMYSVINYNTGAEYQDADTFPTNSVFRILNNTGTDIAHLPAQVGTLLNFSGDIYENGNFDCQIFFGTDGSVHTRQKFSNSWSSWYMLGSQTQLDSLSSYTTSAIALLQKSFLGIQYHSTINYNTGIDYQNADTFPVNSVFKILNNTGTDIANLPQQIGILMNFCPESANANFNSQIFMSPTNEFYYRIKLYNSWTNWNMVVTNTTIPESMIDVFGMLPESATTKTVMLLGDSITQGYGSTGFVSYSEVIDGVTYSVRGNGPDYPYADPDYQTGTFLYQSGTRIWYEALDGAGWGQLLKDYWESKFDCNVLNYGMTGINTGDFSGFLNTLVLPSNADIVILMIGTNDRSSRTLSSYYTNLKSIGSSIINSGKKLIIMAPIPASVANEEDPTRNFHLEDAEHICCKVASELNCNFISLYELFMDYCELTGITIDSLLGDGLHPNDNGYEVMFKLITKETKLNRKRPGATW